MIPLSNCGFEYFTINFRYENAKGFSDFEMAWRPRNSVQAQGSPLGVEVSDPTTSLWAACKSLCWRRP